MTDALEILKNNGTFTEFFYIDDWANKHVNLVYSSFHYHHIDINDNKVLEFNKTEDKDFVIGDLISKTNFS